jgi:hypothetical protein
LESPQVTSAEWIGDNLSIKSKTTFTRGGQISEAISNESWNLIDNGHSIQVKQYSKSPWWGERELVLVFDSQKP